MKTTLATLALALLALAAAGSAADAQYYRYDPYYGYDRPPPRVVVRPSRQPYFDDYSNYYPAVRGYGDRNPVARGNIRGCSVDLGYGRYESCDR
jgi:hypothetical protein